MTRKTVTWIAVMTTMAALAPDIFAIEKQSGPVGVPPETVADYLRAVIMAHRHFYTIHIANRLRQERIVDVSENWRTTHCCRYPYSWCGDERDRRIDRSECPLPLDQSMADQ